MPVKAEVVDIENIGKVHLVPSRKALRMNLSVKGIDKVRIAMPPGYSRQQAIDFAKKHSDWIRKQLVKYQDIRKEKLSEGFRTLFHQLQFTQIDKPSIHIKVQSGIIEIAYPPAISLEHPSVQKAVEEALQITYQKEAKMYLPDRLKHLADEHQLSYKDISIRNMRSRWGSCSAQKSIHLSWHLMKLPSHLIDFVLLHELTHTLEMNHGPRFKAKLNAISGGNYTLYTKELKRYRI